VSGGGGIMQNTCTICQRPDARKIAADLAAGEMSLAAICNKYRIAKTTLLRHRDKCLRPPPAPEVRIITTTPSKSPRPHVYGRTNLCTICRDPHRKAIDKMLIDGSTGRAIVEKYPDVSRTSVMRHRDGCIADLLHVVAAETNGKLAFSVITQLEELRERVWDIMGEAERLVEEAKAELQTASTPDLRQEQRQNIAVAGGMMNTARQLLELCAKITGELNNKSEHLVRDASDWGPLKKAFVGAVVDCAGCTDRVLRALGEMEAA